MTARSPAQDEAGSGRPRRSAGRVRPGGVAFLLALSLVGASVAAGRSSTGGSGESPSYLDTSPPAKPAPVPGNGSGSRSEGDDFASARLIPEIPFSSSGTTCDFADDWDEVCPTAGNACPDVIYRFECAATIEVFVDLCASLYDSKVSVHDGPGGPAIACNDDAGCGYSGWQSRIERVTLQAGHEYYFVVDGYAGCGEYALAIDEYAPCLVECPDSSNPEGEPPCGDGYIDRFNGGCAGNGWVAVEPDSGGCALVCGRSCTYATGDQSYRDSDWYRCFAAGGPVRAAVHAEFAPAMALIYGTDCADLAYIHGDDVPCAESRLEWICTEGQEFWVWVSPATFWGVAESEYLLRICGLRVPVPVRATSWGRIKAQLR